MKGKREERIGRRRGGQPGNRNALKHGLYAAAAIAERRAILALLRVARAHVATVRELL